MKKQPFLRKLKIHTLIQICVFLLLLAVDQITKQFALAFLKDTDGISVLDGVLELVYVENTGAAFGIFRNSIWLFFVISTVVFLILIFLYIRIFLKLRDHIKGERDLRRRTWCNMIALQYILAILAAGAVGNLIDRIIYGSVIDFLYLRFIDFPVFNVADICVTLSVIALIVLFIFFYREDEQFHIFKRI